MYQSDMYNLSMAVIFHRLYTIMWGFSMVGCASTLSLSFSLSKVIRHKERVDTCRESRHKTFSAILSSTVGNKDKVSALKTHNAIYE